MQPGTKYIRETIGGRSSARLISRRSRLVAGALVGTIALTAVMASSSLASVKSPSKAKTPPSSLTKLEASLTTLERGASAGGSLSESGSSLFYPLAGEWSAAKPLGITLQTASTGSGAGQTAAETGTADFGTSDAFLPATAPSGTLNVPIVVSSQMVNYNIPGLSSTVHLHLNATVLNGIYTGQISKWNDPTITALNPKVSLPSTTIVPLHRSDSSGDTFIFTSYLQKGDSSSFVQSQGGASTATVFPNIPQALAAKGNQALLNLSQSTPGSIAYIGISYKREALAKGLGIAALRNGYSLHGAKGNYVTPSQQNISLEVQSFKKIPSSGTISLIFSLSAKNGYPIVNFEYAVVKSGTAHPAELKALLAWGMDPRNGAASKYLLPVNFLPLEPNAMTVAVNLLKSIS